MKRLDVTQNMSIDQMVDLYRQGYSIDVPNYHNQNLNNPNIQSLAFKDVTTSDCIWVVAWSYLAYWLYNNDHPWLAAVPGLFAVMDAGTILEEIGR